LNARLAFGVVGGWQCEIVFGENEAKLANAGYAMGRPRRVAGTDGGAL
jgi:hypothetical protein